MRKFYPIIYFAILFFGLSVDSFAQQVLDLPLEGDRLTKEEYSVYTTVLNGVRSMSKKSSVEELKANYSDIIRFEGERILVDVIAFRSIKKLQKSLSKIDFEQTAAFGKIVTGWIAVHDLDKLKEIKTLRYVRPCYTPIKSIGAVHSQGDSAQYSNTTRLEYGLDGGDLKIGILSDSYNTLSGEAAGVSSGDLPGATNPNGYTTPVTIVKDYSYTGSDEARGMAEIIHDVAPGAQLFARTAFEGEADFAQGILDLRALGCDVIVDDVGYFAEPFFQDGMIAQAVDEVVDDGAVYFSSAGNASRKSYESAFVASGFILGGRPIHDFDPGAGVDYAQKVTIPSGVSLSITLQWDQPFGSLPNSVASCASDMDIRIYNSALSALLQSSVDDNIATGDPLEIVSYTNTSAASIEVNIILIHYAGLAPANMKYVFWTNSATIDEHDTQSATIVGHSNADKAISCGAAAYYNTTAYGAASTSVNSFSSAGGTPILFDKVGNPIPSVTRLKPQVVGPDGTNTTFFGTDIPQDTDTHPNFFGTSASAPHLAGMGALMLEAGATNQEEVLTAMINTAIDLDDPSTGYADNGFDFGTGYGMVQGEDAIVEVLASLPVELVDYQVNLMGRNSALLNWTTATEIDVQSFEIHWRNDESNFEKMAEVNGKGNAQSLNNYQLIVNDLASGNHYFRLVEKGLDGRLTAHTVVSVSILPEAIDIWTFRDFDNQVVAIVPKSTIRYRIEAFDSQGKLMHSALNEAAMGERKTTEWSIENWASGMYYYVVKLEGKSTVLHSGKFML